MRNFKAAALLAVLSLMSVGLVVYGGVAAVFMPLPVSGAVRGNFSSAQSSEVSAEQTLEVSSIPLPTVDSSENTSSHQENVVATDAGGTVSGKIVTRFINPQNAPLKYGNVYIKNNSGAEIDIKDEFEKGIAFKIEKNDQPQVLIMHTHTTESYMLTERDYYTTSDQSRTTDTEKNMAAVGENIAAELTSAGISVLHDKTLHDYPSYNGSYSASAKTVNTYLKKYSSIKVVLDVHRDAIGGNGSDKVKVVKEIDGKSAAQVMLVMGSQTGKITGYPEWKQNLRLAMRFHQNIETMYPSLARPILLASKKYNQNLTTGSMLIEIGTDANTLDEALYSGTLVGKALAKTLSDLM